MTLIRRFDHHEPVAEPDNQLALRSLLRADDTAADLSITWVHLEGHHRRLRSDAGPRIYLVLEGTVRMQVGDESEVDLGVGDLLVIPAGTPYELWGPGIYLVMNQPGFREGDDVYVS